MGSTHGTAPHQFGLQAYQSQSRGSDYHNVRGNSAGPNSDGIGHHHYGSNSAEALSTGGNHQVPPDMDPYAPSIVQDLLTGANEWRNIQDIIKLTLKAVCDVVRT